MNENHQKPLLLLSHANDGGAMTTKTSLKYTVAVERTPPKILIDCRCVLEWWERGGGVWWQGGQHDGRLIG